MQAVFEVEETTQRWAPPFEKKTKIKEFVVNEREPFDTLTEDNAEIMFVFVKLNESKNSALVAYNYKYIVKNDYNYGQPANYQFWIKLNETVCLSHSWGNHGTTKKLKFKGCKQ